MSLLESIFGGSSSSSSSRRRIQKDTALAAETTTTTTAPTPTTTILKKLTLDNAAGVDEPSSSQHGSDTNDGDDVDDVDDKSSRSTSNDSSDSNDDNDNDDDDQGSINDDDRDTDHVDKEDHENDNDVAKDQNQSVLSSLFATKIDVPERRLIPPQPRTSNQHVRLKENEAEESKDEMILINGGNNDVKTAEDDSINERTVFVGNLPVSTTHKQLAHFFRQHVHLVPFGDGDNDDNDKEDNSNNRIKDNDDTPVSIVQVISARIRSAAVSGVKLPPHMAGQQHIARKVATHQQLIDTTYKNAVHGYVVFADRRAAAAALQLNHCIIHPDQLIKIESKETTESATATASATTTTQVRRLRVDMAVPSHDASHCVFLGNLPFQAQEDVLQHAVQEHFQINDDQEIVHVRIVRDKDTGRGKGFAYVQFRNMETVAHVLRQAQREQQQQQQEQQQQAACAAFTIDKRPIRVMVCGKRYKSRQEQSKQKRRSKRQQQQQEQSWEELSRGSAKRLKTSQQPQQQLQQQGSGLNNITSHAAITDTSNNNDSNNNNNTLVTKAIGAVRRILQKQQQQQEQYQSRRRSNSKTHSVVGGSGAGVVSKRSAQQVKVNKGVRKLEKRISKGMGKMRKQSSIKK